MQMPVKIAGLGMLCLLASSYSLAGGCSVKSGESRTALLELYTSEGCSSCPPADRWLSRITPSEHVIPIAWHVDYWDYIGWKDKFANPRYSSRQRDMAALAGSGFVYTPQVMLNGRDFRGWASSGRFESVLSGINRSKSKADIEMRVELGLGGMSEVTISARAPDIKHAAIHLVMYESGLSTEVKAGENNGSILRHDSVVREWSGPYPLEGESVKVWKQKLLIKPDWDKNRMGIVAFVQDARSGEVLQAASTKICG